jgi:large subunit ribosomal protein L21
MFAVLKTGGKQYRVQTGDVLRVEKLAAQPGETVQFNEILMVGGDETLVGAPLIEDAGVNAEVIDQIKGEKVIHFVRRRRKHSSKRTKGHRQQLTLLRVTEILASGAGASGIQAAIGAGGVADAVVADGRYAQNRTDQAEMKRRVQAGEADEKAAAVVSGETGAEAAPAGSKPGNLLDAPREGGADDLKRLSGVGPKLETLLNENGVYHFEQIAAWSDDEVAWMDAQLSFKGRIARENWIEQAKALAAEEE